MDDFSREQVPVDKTCSGIHIGMIIVGGVIGIPGFLQAARVGGSLGLEKAAVAFLAGCFILGCLGALTSYAGARTRYSTYMLTAFAFGRSGGKIVNFIIALTLVGWYGVIINVFASAADLVVQSVYGQGVPVWAYIVTGSCLMIGVTLSGFKGIDKLALCLVPVMLVFLVYAAWLSWDDIPSWNRGSAGAQPLSYSHGNLVSRRRIHRRRNYPAGLQPFCKERAPRHGGGSSSPCGRCRHWFFPGGHSQRRHGGIEPDQDHGHAGYRRSRFFPVAAQFMVQ